MKMIKIFVLFVVVLVSIRVNSRKVRTQTNKTYKVTVIYENTPMATGTINTDSIENPNEEQKKGLFITTSDIKEELKSIMVNSGKDWYIPYKNCFVGFLFSNPVVESAFILTIISTDVEKNYDIKILFEPLVIKGVEGEKLVVSLNTLVNNYQNTINSLKKEAFSLAKDVINTEASIEAAKAGEKGIQEQIKIASDDLMKLENDRKNKLTELEEIEKKISESEKEFVGLKNSQKENTVKLIQNRDLIDSKEKFLKELSENSEKIDVKKLEKKSQELKTSFEAKIKELKDECPDAEMIINQTSDFILKDKDLTQFTNKLNEI